MRRRPPIMSAFSDRVDSTHRPVWRDDCGSQAASRRGTFTRQNFLSLGLYSATGALPSSTARSIHCAAREPLAPR
jgi:hypothetical protein